MTDILQSVSIAILALAVIVLARAVFNLDKTVRLLLHEQDNDGPTISASRVSKLFFGRRPE